jgi:pyruvate dehydrogenase (quinone)
VSRSSDCRLVQPRLASSKLSFVELEMQAAGYPRFATYLTNPDFAKYAKICGGEGVRVTHPDEARPVMERALASNRPFIIDAIVNPDELVMPPNITVNETWSFATGKTKE